MFTTGSYPYAEIYELNYTEEEVINVIAKLKASDTDLIVSKVTIQSRGQSDLHDGKEGISDYGYKFYFYDKGRNEILFT